MCAHTHFLKDGKTQQEELEILKRSTSGGMKLFHFMNLCLNSHSQNKSKQDSVAPSRRSKSGVVVQATPRAFSGKSQFQQPEDHSVV